MNDATINGSETGSSFRQALHFMDLGLRLHDTMIYEKTGTAFASGVKSVRYTQQFEYFFILSKGNSSEPKFISDFIILSLPETLILFSFKNEPLPSSQ